MHTKRLHLRISAENAEAGRVFARQFVDALAAASDGLPPARIGALRLQVRSTADTGAVHAAQAVMAHLSRGGSNHA